MKIILLFIILILLVWCIAVLYCKFTSKEITINFFIWINTYLEIKITAEITSVWIFKIK